MAGVVCLQDGDDIPDSDHVVRYCSPRHVHNGEISESAFSLRLGEKYISVNWLEYFTGNISQRLQDVKNSIGLELSPNGKFAMIPVGEAKGKIENLQIKYHPVHPNNSHAGLHFSGSEQNREQTLELANIAANNESFSSA